MYPQTIELEVDKYGDAREAKGIIEMGLEANMSSKQIISSLMKFCRLTPAAAKDAYDSYISERIAESAPEQPI